MKIYPYLNFNGNCKAAFTFYEQHLGGKITAMMTHAEAPTQQQMPPEWGSAILFARITIGDSELMASDVPPEHQKPMRSVYLSLAVADSAEAERVFSALKEGGEVLMPLQETFWAFRFGTVRDQFGVLWMINADKPMPPQAK
jgi:PhnB protein